MNLLPRLSLSSLAGFVLLTGAVAQTTASPYSLVTVAVAANGTTAAQGEFYRIDHQTNSATKIKIPTLFNTDRPNTVYMSTPVTGYFATNHVSSAATPGNVYSFTLAGTTFLLGNSGKPLNTSAFAGGNLAQIAIVGSKLYTVSQTYNTTTSRAEVGKLQSIPVAGGAVTVEYDCAAVAASTNLTNALCAIGSKLYVGMWYLSSAATTGGEIIVYDTVTKKGAKLMDLPLGKYKGGGSSKYSYGIVNMQATSSGNLACIGVYGDLAILNPTTKTVVSHDFTGGTNSTGNPVVNTTNSGFFDATTNDWVIGSRDGTMERWANGHAALKVVAGVGSHPTGTRNSVNGTWHFPNAKNSDITYGGGCPAKTGGFTPTDVAKGAAVAGNANFELALYSGTGGETFLLTIGLNNKKAFGGAVALPWNMAGIGAPGCMLRVDPLIFIGGKLSGTGAGTGSVSIKVPLPASLPKSAFVHRQWAVNEPAGVLVVSNARTLTIK